MKANYAIALRVFLTSGAAVALLQTIMSPAAATTYTAVISGTIYNSGAEQSSFGEGGNPQATQAQYGRTATNWQVGADASPSYGGTATSNIQLAPRDPDSVYDYAQTLLGHSEVAYQLYLSGSGSDQFVPVQVKAQGSISWSEYGSAEAYFRLTDYSHPLPGNAPLPGAFADIRQGNNNTNLKAGNLGFGVDETIDLKPGDTYAILLFTTAFADVRNIVATDNSYAEVSAIVDPSFTVLGDYASRWSISGVPAVQSAVPELSTWAMMLLGFFGIGFLFYHRRCQTLLPGAHT
ncbi:MULTISPECIES: hypothetical protein [unclassified Bradyrhizobium]